MKRFFAGLLAVCLVGAAFAGCSGSSANYNVNDVASAVETVAKIENPLDITEDDLTYEFGVDMDKVEEFSRFINGLQTWMDAFPQELEKEIEQQPGKPPR